MSLSNFFNFFSKNWNQDIDKRFSQNICKHRLKNLSLSPPPLVRFRFKIQYGQKFNRLHCLQNIKFSLHSLSNNFFLVDEGRRVSSFQLVNAVQMPASKDSTTLGSDLTPFIGPRWLQRVVVYPCGPIAPSYSSPNAGDAARSGVSANRYSSAHHVTWSPNKLWRSNSIFNQWSTPCTVSLSFSFFCGDPWDRPATLYCPSRLLLSFPARRPVGPATLYCPYKLLYIFFLPGDLRDRTPLQCPFFSTETRGICYPTAVLLWLVFSARKPIGPYTLHPKFLIRFLCSETRKTWRSSQALYTHYYRPLLGYPWGLSKPPSRFLLRFGDLQDLLPSAVPLLLLLLLAPPFLYDMDFKD